MAESAASGQRLALFRVPFSQSHAGAAAVFVDELDADRFESAADC
jgi:hypothetical protein